MKIISNILLLSLILSACNQDNSSSKSSRAGINKNEITQYLLENIDVHQIPGLGVAIIQNGELVYEEYFGYGSIENRDSVEKSTIFRIYSATKLMTATGIFELVERGKLSVHEPISKYLDDLPKAWEDVKIEHLLTHSSGVPDIIRYDMDLSDEVLLDRMAKDGIDFTPGDRFWYNQTNYWLLARIIQKIEGISFEEKILKHQFKNDSGRVFFSSNSSDSIPNRVNRYEFNSKTQELEVIKHNDGIRAHPGNGINISLPALVNWNQRLDKGQLLSLETKEKMWQPYNFADQTSSFRYGWGDYSSMGVNAVGFTGGGVCGIRKYPEKDLTVIYLSNGQKYFPIHNTIINHLANMVDSSIVNPRSNKEEAIITTFLKNPVQKAISDYHSIKKDNPEEGFEGVINTLGYAIMREKRVKEAIEVFELNVAEHPNSSNVYDSLGEAYYNDKQYDKAIKNYKKSLELNKNNKNAEVMLDVIKKETS